MKVKVFINWEEIKSFDDFFDSFLPQVKSPDWHGRNLNAFRDSIITGDINQIEPPYCIINAGIKDMKAEAKEVYIAVEEIFLEAKESGREIRIFNE